ncbi:MAG TPA: DUF998 domain-containing protein [Hanamia sp.]|nr:DUF998 domain-containing protein [Hanamia sp.]
MTTTTMENQRKELHAQKKGVQPRWQWIILLIVLGYEGAGCLVGGIFLLVEPDGRLMDMPVEIMHGVFRDFLVPGIILFGLGILNIVAFVSALRRKASDWFISSLALGGLFLWFVVEIIILQELHWLHLMWGFPVLIGWVVLIPLIVLRNDIEMMRKALLTCGILSSLWYASINIFVPIMYAGYSPISFTVSELSAIGAPTRILWVMLALLYPLLFVFFGWGVLKSSRGNHSLEITGTLIIIYSIFNFYWPPMHQREVIAMGAGTLSDTLHIVWAMITLLFMMLMMGFGAVALGKRFRLYTIATWVVFFVFGILTWLESPGIEKNLPTPWIGVWERINIGAFILWVIILAIVLLRRERNLNSYGNRHVSE